MKIKSWGYILEVNLACLLQWVNHNKTMASTIVYKRWLLHLNSSYQVKLVLFSSQGNTKIIERGIEMEVNPYYGSENGG